MKLNPISKVANFAYKKLLKFPRWMGIRQVKIGSEYLSTGVKHLINIPEKGDAETFEEAVTRLNLSESDLKAAQMGYLRNSCIFAGLALVLIGYAIYLLISGAWLSCVLVSFMSAAVTCILIYTHFWYFQIKKRKLGCSIKEWFCSQ